jgi:excinuclease ABC subunit C
LASFVNQYYEDNFIPDEVLLPIDLGMEINKLLQKVLEERGRPQVRVLVGTNDDAQALIMLANKHAEEHFKSHLSKSEDKQKGLAHIQEKLSLPELPSRIECYDISNFQGKESVASQVVFEDGAPSKDHYRRYKIKTVIGANDYASMQEVLSRRFAHSEWDDPQLIVIDGGKGQLRVAVEILNEIGKGSVPVVGLAKARTQGDFSDREVGATEERFYLPGRQNPVVFRPNTEAFRILVSIRDEAHRFALSYHRKLREGSSMESILDNIHGLGPKGKTELLKTFQSIELLRSAKVDELLKVRGISLAVATEIINQIGLPSTVTAEDLGTQGEGLSEDSELTLTGTLTDESDLVEISQIKDLRDLTGMKKEE